jgi:hypothetical protein
MVDIDPVRENIQIEETQFRGAVSEALLQKAGAAVNFINTYQTNFFEFGFLLAISDGGTPTYNTFSAPLVISAPEAFPTDSEIYQIQLIHNMPGSSGTTELDIEWSTENSNTWNSIFSTLPAVTSAAPSNAQFDMLGIATTPTRCTVPVLDVTEFSAGDRLRCRVTSLQGGSPNGFMMKIFYRPI